MKPYELMIVNGVTLRPDGRYNQYRAADCRKTGLPMLDGASRYRPGAPAYYSRSQRAKMGIPVEPEELPAAWYRMFYGYVPLYADPKKGETDDGL